MSLKDLNDKIYSRNLDLSERNYKESQINPSYHKEGNGDNPFLKESSGWQDKEKGLSKKQKKMIGILSGVLALVIIIVGSFVFISIRKKNAFQQDKVTVNFDGPKTTDSAQMVRYLIKYKNDNNILLENAELILNYSENFQPDEGSNINFKQLNPSSGRIYIGDIKAHDAGETQINGVFYAPKDTQIYLNATLAYSPSNLSVQYEAKNQIGVSVATSPMLLEVSAPMEATSGDLVTYVVDYKNLDTKSLNDSQLHVIYPDGFGEIAAEPSPSQGNNVWNFGILESQQGGKIIIKGKISGDGNQEKTIKVQFGGSGNHGQFVAFNEREKTIKIIESALLISQSLDGKNDQSINQGETLYYIIKYKNKSTEAFKDLVVSEKIQSEILDFKNIQTNHGYFNASSKTITWRASDLAQLANLDPGMEGEIRFSIPVLSAINIKNESSRNFTVNSVASIDSSNYLDPGGSSRVVSSNELDIKLNSKALFKVEGFYNDDKIKNSGPLPMKIGSQTDFAIHWSIINYSNDLSGAKIVSSLPTGIKWTGVVYPSGEKISYNERTNEVVWEIGDIPAGSGFYKSSKEVVFQVGVVPQSNQIGSEVKIINPSKFTAGDSFTGNKIIVDVKEKTTNLPEDSLLSSQSYKVGS